MNVYTQKPFSPVSTNGVEAQNVGKTSIVCLYLQQVSTHSYRVCVYINVLCLYDSAATFSEMFVQSKC